MQFWIACTECDGPSHSCPIICISSGAGCRLPQMRTELKFYAETENLVFGFEWLGQGRRPFYSSRSLESTCILSKSSSRAISYFSFSGERPGSDDLDTGGKIQRYTICCTVFVPYRLKKFPWEFCVPILDHLLAKCAIRLFTYQKCVSTKTVILLLNVNPNNLFFLQ